MTPGDKLKMRFTRDDKRTMRARAQRYRNLAADCRLMARNWDDADIATSFANAATELETVASAILEKVNE